MQGYMLQPAGKGGRFREGELSVEATEQALPLLDALPVPALWIGPDHMVRWRNRIARLTYGDEELPCFRLVHRLEESCDHHGEACPLPCSRVVERTVGQAHVHEGRRGHGFYKVSALRLEGGDVVELHWPLDDVIVRDALTGAHTRSFFEQMVRHELDLMKRMGQPFSLILLDVDGLKRLNDSHGHALGDAALRALGRCLIATARGSDVVGRLGGDEFCLFLPATRPHSAAAVARRMRAALRAVGPPDLPANERLTVSVGIAGGTQHYDLDATLAAADRALYRAKAAGRDRIAVG